MEAQDFLVEELLDYPNGDENMAEAFFGGSATGNSTDSSVTAVHSSNSSVCGGADNGFGRSSADAHLAGEICLPYDDDAAELEWLSNFVEESFSSDVLHKHHFFSGAGADQARSETSITGKARSRLAGRIAPSDWSTAAPGGGPAKKPGRKRAEISDRPEIGEVRRCQHCAAEKTPQWRTGPMGPKTLCNACGVRYKSGRLVPEYRPASSPTFVSTKHSNSHRKVLELRRQNEVIQMHHHQRFMEHGAVAGVFGHGGAAAGGDYLMHHHHGSPDYRRLI